MVRSAKAKKLPVHVFQIGEVAVQLTGVSPRTRANPFHKGPNGLPRQDPTERNLYDVQVDGEFVGRVHRSYGFGKQPYIVERLGYRDIASDRIVHGRGQPYRDPKIFELEEIAAKIVELRVAIDSKTKFPILHTEEQYAAYCAAEAEATRIRNAEQAERSRQLAEDIKANKAEAERVRVETQEGLISIRERLGTSLTNFELNALMAAIEHYSRKPYDYWDEVKKHDD